MKTDPDQHLLTPATGTSLPASLVVSYLDTDYYVHPAENQPGFTLHIGIQGPELKSLMMRHSASSAAFITACNPLGVALSAECNQERHSALQQTLSRRSLPHFSGIGRGTSGDWPGEDSLLVLGLDLVAAKRLASEVEQNAFVWADAHAVPKLILLR